MHALVGISACSENVDDVASHCVGDKYARAVAEAAGCIPVLIPALADELDVRALLERLDGVLVTGSDSNVAPQRYGGDDSRQSAADLDPERDATMLPLLRIAVTTGVPVLALCRGHQELNVALGGTLAQFVHEQPGRHDHREDATCARDERYGPAHTVHLAPQGVLAGLFGCESLAVNSLHEQAIDRLAPGLTVEGRADDGVIEAARVADAPAFAISTQWHPEWQAVQNPYSRALFEAFGKACRERAASRTPVAG
jgi:putative glutamine amidotransferase